MEEEYAEAKALATDNVEDEEENSENTGRRRRTTARKPVQNRK